jgi:ABC-type multidrug transport system fused ATPase/permease subunit
MSSYLRLLGYLRPYRGRLILAVGCMLVYALMSGASLGMVSPFVQVLFGRAQADPETAAVQLERSRAAAAEPLRLGRPERWPELLKARAERALLDARPIVALERVCIAILIVLFLKNLADYLQGFLMVSVEQAALRDLRNMVFALVINL